MVFEFFSEDESVVTEARRRYDAHWTDASHTILPAEYKSVVYKIVLKNGGLKEYEEVLKVVTLLPLLWF